MRLCTRRHAEVVTWLLQQGANPMLFDSIHSRVCLHYCALYGQAGCIDALFSDDAYVRMSAGPALLRNAHVLDSQGFHKCVSHLPSGSPCLLPILKCGSSVLVPSTFLVSARCVRVCSGKARERNSIQTEKQPSCMAGTSTCERPWALPAFTWRRRRATGRRWWRC